MAKALMSDAEIRRRKKLQGHISQTTGALGLTAAGATLVASRGGRSALRKIPQLESRIRKPPPRDPHRDRIKAATVPVLAASAGLGGVGAFNFASYTNAESRKRKAMAVPPKKVSKRDEMAPEFGEVAKAWQPQTKPYNPEANRAKRNNVTQTGLEVGGGTALAAGAGQSVIAGRVRGRAKGLERAASATDKATRKKVGIGPLTEKQTLKVASGYKKAKVARKLATRNIRTAGGLVGAGAAATGAGQYIRHRKKSESWQPYAKRDSHSAFGVNHGEPWPLGQSPDEPSYLPQQA